MDTITKNDLDALRNLIVSDIENLIKAKLANWLDAK